MARRANAPQIGRIGTAFSEVSAGRAGLSGRPRGRVLPDMADARIGRGQKVGQHAVARFDRALIDAGLDMPRSSAPRSATAAPG